jgi:hypothetical protein
MVNGCHSKHYLKDFNTSTALSEDSYPTYHRPDNGCSHEVCKRNLDNQWIVPYCPFLSAKYNCHINVESAASFGSIKYMTKYLHKGYNCTTLAIDQRDEISTYINA